MSDINPTGTDVRLSRPSYHSQTLYHGDPLSRAPPLGAITDDHDPELRPPPAIALMQQNNRSVPSLPSERQAQQDGETHPPAVPFDPTSTLDQFSALHITDPHPPAMNPRHAADPIPRVGSSMSMRSTQPSQHASRPRNAHTLPPGPAHSLRSSFPSEDATAKAYAAAPDAFHDGDYASLYSQDDLSTNYSSPESITFPPNGPAYSQQQWQPRPQEYNPLYAAASNVLGMAPPPGPPPSSTPVPYPPAPGAGYGAEYPAYTNNQPPPPNMGQTGPYGGPSANQSYSSYSTPAPSTLASPEREFEPRPSLHRSGTSASVSLATHKTKAVDLTAPPYTKEYIDQYRQRIKADPDPEAHFLYAKYLIDAAKKIRMTAKDQRAGKKYSEVLIAESLKVMRRLATQGEVYAEAQFFLANCHGTGALGLQVDHERAYHLYLQAAKQNHPAACYRVAVCNEIGAGTRKEPPRAAAFYRKAASLGDTPAMYKLGMILLNGSLGEQKNPREAITWLRRAAEQADEENPHALHELGLLHESPTSQLVPHDPILAKNLFTQAAQLGYTPSQYKLGQCYEYGTLTCPMDPRRSIAWYTKAAEKGDPEAELALSGWYLTGSEGVLKQSDSEAYLWARRAANKGLSKAEYAVGYYAEVGIGIKQDIDFAKRWYMRAAAQGNKRAMNRLTEMKRMGNKRANASRPTRQEAKDECVIC